MNTSAALRRRFYPDFFQTVLPLSAVQHFRAPLLIWRAHANSPAQGGGENSPAAEGVASPPSMDGESSAYREGAGRAPISAGDQEDLGIRPQISFLPSFPVRRVLRHAKRVKTPTRMHVLSAPQAKECRRSKVTGRSY